MPYEAALESGRKAGASHASDPELMALFCDGPLQLLAGAVSPCLVWEGAQRESLTSLQLAQIVRSDPLAAADLMWA
jgi:hypothetical protein